MYSVVMLLALAGTAEAQECHRSRGCCGCYGGGYGGYGYGCGGCYGGYGCYGGCYGGGGYGYGGGYGRGYGYGCGGCYGGGCYGGGYGCGGCFGSYGYYGGSVINPGAPIAPVAPMPGNPSSAPPMPAPAPAPASIQVNLPTDAVIYFDGFRTTASGSRRYTTPALEPGKTYFYNVKIELNHDGQQISTTERVIVRAGEQAQVSFELTPTGTVTARQY